MTYLTSTEVFKTGPAAWADPETGEWMHRGHVDETTANQALAKAIHPGHDRLEIVPGTLQHQWARFAKHDPQAGCDDDWCDCEADDDETYLWWEKTTPGADGAIPVTWMTVRSIEEEW